MLGAHPATATLAVKDLKAARSFYTTTLGLELLDENEEALTFKAAGTQLIVYRSAYAGTNRATGVTWPLGQELESVVKALASRGVQFEHYDLPGLTREGDLHVSGTFKTAWFKDPDGNIHGLMSG